jgi:hypothetical protein
MCDFIVLCSHSSQDHEFRYLLQTVRYDRSKNPGPPKSVSEEDVRNYFGSWADIKEVEKYVIPDDSPMRKVSKNYEPDFHEIFFLLSNKNVKEQ